MKKSSICFVICMAAFLHAETVVVVSEPFTFPNSVSVASRSATVRMHGDVSLTLRGVIPTLRWNLPAGFIGGQLELLRPDGRIVYRTVLENSSGEAVFAQATAGHGMYLVCVRAGALRFIAKAVHP